MKTRFKWNEKIYGVFGRCILNDKKMKNYNNKKKLWSLLLLLLWYISNDDEKSVSSSVYLMIKFYIKKSYCVLCISMFSFHFSIKQANKCEIKKKHNLDFNSIFIYWFFECVQKFQLLPHLTWISSLSYLLSEWMETPCKHVTITFWMSQNAVHEYKSSWKLFYWVMQQYLLVCVSLRFRNFLFDFLNKRSKKYWSK